MRDAQFAEWRDHARTLLTVLETDPKRFLRNKADRARFLELALEITSMDVSSACPSCGSSDVEGGFVSIEGTNAFQDCTCAECGASWTDVYALVANDMGD